MAKHIKPTKEELQENISKVVEETEDMEEVKEKEVEEMIEKVEPKEPEVEEPEVEEEIEQEEQAYPSEEVKEKLKVEVKEKEEKLSASARENQKIYAKNRVINQALADAEEIPEPTEEELQSEFKDWDVMSDLERTLAKETVVSRNWRATIKKAKDQAEKIVKWEEEVDKYITDPKILNEIPDLEGKTEEFKEFAKQDENNSVPFSILTKAFLYQKSTELKPNKGKMFEGGSGGPNNKGKESNGKLTIEEGRKLRDTNYDKWKELLMAGKIETEI